MTYRMRIASSIAINSLERELHHNFNWLKERGCSIETRYEQQDRYHCLLVTLHYPRKGVLFREEDFVYIFKYQLAEIVAEHIISLWEEELVKRRLDKTYRGLLPEERSLILEKALSFMRCCDDSESLGLLMRFGRKSRIAHRVLDHLLEHDMLILDGFVSFYLRDYLKEIQFAVDLAWEEVNNEREYNEFVKLLRYFVDSQPSRVLEVNLMMTGAGGFSMWDESGNSLDETYVRGCLEEIFTDDISTDDVLVSVLITLAPRRVVLHGSSGKLPCNESIKIIKKVFKEKIVTCTGCDRCRESLIKKGDV